MDLISLSCNKCGAPLEVPTGANFLTCGYCGSRLAIRSHGNAHYTEVLGQIDQKTSQILQKVNEIAEMSDTHAQWETCEIISQRVKLSMFQTGSQFLASAIGIQGRYANVYSSIFKGRLQIVGDIYIPMKTAEAIEAHREIRTYLKEDGWEPVVYDGPFWFSMRFRRRL